MIRYTLYICLFTILFTSCRNDPDEVIISPELQPYFDLFQEEGQKRGVDVDFTVTPIEGRVANLFDSNVNGWCDTKEDKPHEIIIDDSFWNGASNFDKEFIIMHELGHCYLNLGHNDAVDGDGNCISIMHSSTESCVFPYNQETRDDYLDELFN